MRSSSLVVNISGIKRDQIIETETKTKLLRPGLRPRPSVCLCVCVLVAETYLRWKYVYCYYYLLLLRASSHIPNMQPSLTYVHKTRLVEQEVS